MPTPKEAFCDYFDQAPMLLRMNVALLAMVLLTLPFLSRGSASFTIAVIAVVPLTASIVGLLVCNWYCDWGRIAIDPDDDRDPARRKH